MSSVGLASGVGTLRVQGLAITPFRAFVAFAGGGAKGLAHVGALKALEEGKVEFRGFAGTSAGAIVATLAAAGMKADEIIDPHSGDSIITALSRHEPTIVRPVDLFGPNGWPVVHAFRRVVDFFRKHPRQVPGLLVLLGAAAVALAVLTIFSAVIRGWEGSMIALMGWVLVWGTILATTAHFSSGLARLETFQGALNKYLSERLFGQGSQRIATMADFNGDTFPLLKIVAANISKRRLEVFTCDLRPEVTVADAVAASICLPLIFAPWLIGRDHFVDGGVVSNFPAWPFDEERSLDRDAITVGFQIEDPLAEGDQPGKRLRPPPWPLAVIQTALFGSTQLSTRAVGRAELITLRPEVELMDFDLSKDEVREKLADMTQAARAEVNERLFLFPAVYRNACSNARDLVVGVLRRNSDQLLKNQRRKGRVRCAVAMPPQDYHHSLQLRHGVGYENDPDQDLLLPLDGSLAGEAWSTRQPVLELSPRDEGRELARPRDASLRRLLWHELEWSLRVPICGKDGKPFLVVAVDGSAPLLDTNQTITTFDYIVDEIGAIFAPVIRQFEEP